MNALLNIACGVNGHDASTVSRGCKGSNLIEFGSACVVEPGRPHHQPWPWAQRRWVATQAAKPNGARHEQYPGDIHLVDRARGRAPTCRGSARRAREADRPARSELAGLV